MKFTDLFAHFSKWTARITGRPITFLIALLVIVVWALTGPIFHFSDTWQLVINTSTTIITFLMVFLIQNTQYRDSEAIHIKLDELIRAIKGANNILVDMEEASEEELERMRAYYQQLAHQAKEALERGKKDTGGSNVTVVFNDPEVKPEAEDNDHLTNK
ncbi:MAG: low affinity iron permease family protein [Chloroflexi bacterium]|nr:low affinity iron permease family protein [Chloroflexota bacterium]